MSKEFDFEWKEGAEIDGAHYCPDHLDRARYAQFLTGFLNQQDQSKPYVLNLNSGWGTGKTYFLKRWSEDLKKRHPVVYIDAWRDDHSDDPFMTVISSIISQLRSKTSYDDDNLFVRGVSKSLSLFKAMGPLLFGAAAKKYLGKDMSELAAMLDGESSDLSKEVGDAANNMAQFLISSHNKKSESVKALKKSIIDWIGSVIGQNTEITGPTFVIIDELDRCRPSYAVETLETVKHIFDIPGVFFIIATDTEQLQHAIKIVYGSGFDAQTYLSRFFDSRFSLRETSLISFIEAHCQVDFLGYEYANNKKLYCGQYMNHH
ncbi:KAP family NTPase [Aeromonas caviae]|uniref:KAP family P-loop NTPase fold protein n=1 Tax=Aeromonas caviae TaxID=648 RepID=UPI001EF03DE5|nr:P-loop NTPase fold protein [Aeromonas caviae]ULH03223.1 KAP family NTPase [Aeromonas caviae]